MIENGSWIVDHFSSIGAQKVTDFWGEQILTDQETADLLASVVAYCEPNIPTSADFSSTWLTDVTVRLSSLGGQFGDASSSVLEPPGFLSRIEYEMGYSLNKYLPFLHDPSNTWYSSISAYPELYQYEEYTLDNQSIHNLRYHAVLGSGYQDYIDHFETWSHPRGIGYCAVINHFTTFL